MSHSNAKPDPKLMNSLQSNLVRYADSSDFKKIVLNVIANRSSTDELFELRKAFAEYDKDGSGVIDLSEFKKALAHCNYTDKEIESIFNRIVRIFMATYVKRLFPD
jgi:Ca2+-binding EF-hand superfamily protein